MVLIDIDRSRENAINCGIRAMDFATNDVVFREEIKGVLRGIINEIKLKESNPVNQGGRSRPREVSDKRIRS